MAATKEDQIETMKRRLQDIPKSINGVYNRKYFSLDAKIRNLQAEVDKAKWNDFLAR